MERIRAEGILFDNDGVLVDSHREVVEAWSQVAREYDLPIERLMIELVGVRSIDTLGKYLEGDTLLEADRRLEVLEVEYADRTRPLTGAIELVSQLPIDRWSIVTSGTDKLARARWTGAGIPIPPIVVTADDVQHGKPHPEPFLVGASRLGLDPTKVVVFEDSPAGGQAGIDAGATVIAVGDQEWTVEPRTRVHDLSEVAVTMLDDGSIELTIGS